VTYVTRQTQGFSASIPSRDRIRPKSKGHRLIGSVLVTTPPAGTLRRFRRGTEMGQVVHELVAVGS